MSLERTTWRNGLLWLNFRMIANVIGITANGILRFLGAILELTTVAIFTAIALAIVWLIWTKFGHLLQL